MAHRWLRIVQCPLSLPVLPMVEIGPQADKLTGENPPLIGELRVGYLLTAGQLSPAPSLRAWVQTADGVNSIGPIDMPLVLPVEFPVRVSFERITNARAADTTLVVAGAVGGQMTGLRWSASLLLTLVANVVTPLPQWGNSVSVYGPAVAVDLLDAAGATIATVTGPAFDIPRPRACIAVRTAAANGTPILIAYGS